MLSPLKKVKIPVLELSWGFAMTVEGCHLWNRDRYTYERIAEALPGVPEMFLFSPKPGEYVNRAMLWKYFLSDLLSVEDRRRAMKHILRFYINTKLGSAGKGE